MPSGQSSSDAVDVDDPCVMAMALEKSEQNAKTRKALRIVPKGPSSEDVVIEVVSSDPDDDFVEIEEVPPIAQVPGLHPAPAPMSVDDDDEIEYLGTRHQRTSSPGPDDFNDQPRRPPCLYKTGERPPSKKARTAGPERLVRNAQVVAGSSKRRATDERPPSKKARTAGPGRLARNAQAVAGSSKRRATDEIAPASKKTRRDPDDVATNLRSLGMRDSYRPTPARAFSEIQDIHTASDDDWPYGIYDNGPASDDNLAREEGFARDDDDSAESDTGTDLGSDFDTDPSESRFASKEWLELLDSTPSSDVKNLKYLRRDIRTAKNYRGSRGSMRGSRVHSWLDRLDRATSFADQLHLGDLCLTENFHEARAGISRIVQKDIWAACGSFVVDGDQDCAGSLIVLKRDETVFPRTIRDECDHFPDKCTKQKVLDLVFDPLTMRLASSGSNKDLLIWHQLDKEEWGRSAGPESSKYYKLAHQYKYNKPPHILAFCPGGSTLAVGADELEIIVDIDDGNRRQFPVAEGRMRHLVSAVVWGSGPSAGHVFASTEPETFADQVDPPPAGVHKGFDIEVKTSYELLLPGSADSGSGEALAVNDSGERLALVTECASEHLLQIYNLRASGARGTPDLRIVLPPFDFGVRTTNNCAEVNHAYFAPGTSHLLALARGDNVAHVYDLRQTRRPMHAYAHRGDCVAPGNIFHGVTRAEWVSGARLGLVTAGADGCVRLWDPSISSDGDDNCTILAELHYDINTFSLGQPGTRERSLMVGDSRGAVYVYQQGYHPESRRRRD
ncbi:hypothetical protein BD626DRAFT_567422 [Schizophyllum amplum]|uniref:WD40-repeat-containing domain protein n=1 Tax=Schizophyllum amplum TaxID=97359 RepID=A0A550CL81_9AGAR|nr:hypothetical protein BD626DRAFT_567422 [Auriculariopsis ampla]